MMIRRFLRWIIGLFRLKKNIPSKIYTLDEYLEIVSKYTDSLIMNEHKNGRFFTGGDCTVSYQEGKILFSIKMYFINSQKDRILKEATRTLRADNFDPATQNSIKECNKVFEINKPYMEE